MEEENTSDKKSIGTVVCSDRNNGTMERREVKNFLRSTFKDHRLISVVEVDQEEENTFIISVENPESTGRATVSNIHLSKQSFSAVIAACMLFQMGKEVDLDKELRESVQGEAVEFSFGGNEMKGLDFLKVD